MLIGAAALPAQQPATSPTPPSAAGGKTAPSQGWASELMFDIFESPNPQASEALYHATFAAGPAIVPQLQAALKNDRTATFAAQSLAYIGSPKALQILSSLANESRNLDLRQYYYGALGQFDDPKATDALLNEIAAAAKQPDRATAQTAIIALTVHSDPALPPRLRSLAKQVTDVVIQDDLENAADVIEARAKYLATPAGKKTGNSIENAVRTYFMPAFEQAGVDSSPILASGKKKPKLEKPPVDVHVVSVTFSPDGNRALTHVIFETPEALANYEMVLQKSAGDWKLGSVWLGTEHEKPGARSTGK